MGMPNTYQRPRRQALERIRQANNMDIRILNGRQLTNEKFALKLVKSQAEYKTGGQRNDQFAYEIAELGGLLRHIPTDGSPSKHSEI